jgi:hypothetical protein
MASPSSPLPPSDSTGTLTVTSETFNAFYHNDSFSTKGLSEDVLSNIIRLHSAKIQAADNRYRLDDLLSALLKYAPHPLGRRYIALSLLAAHQEGEDGLVRAARAWLDGLLLPSVFVDLYLFVH